MLRLSLSQTEKQQLLDKLVNEGWLDCVQGGHYRLGVRLVCVVCFAHCCTQARTFMELGNTLLNLDLPAATREAWQRVV